MIDARVDDAVKQHLQKMDWLHGEDEAKSLTPPPAGAAGNEGKLGFNLPLSETPQAQEVIAPILELNTKEEIGSMPPPSDGDQSAEGKSGVPAGQDCEEAVKAEVKTAEVKTAEVKTAEESISQPDASTDSDHKLGKEDKAGSSPPKDGTPV